MVSALWKACSEGDLDSVVELLKEASSIDIEIKGERDISLADSSAISNYS